MAVQKPEEYEAAVKELSKIRGIIEESSDRHNVHLITIPCTCTKENSISTNIEDFNLLHIFPVIFEQGWEYYRIIAFTHKDLNRFMQRLEDKRYTYKVIRKAPFEGFIASSLALTADALFSELTVKQIDALLSSYGMGYYQLPRKANVKTIAQQKHVPRTTFEEHLRKAENKLVCGLVPYLQLFRQTLKKKVANASRMD